MRRTILVGTVVFALLALLLYAFHSKYLYSRINGIKQIYQKRIADLTSTISLSYFQRDRVYLYVVQNRFEELKSWLDQVRQYYPYIERIEFLDIDRTDFDLFKLFSSGTKIHVIMKIYNGDASLYVPNKVAFLILNAQNILEQVDPSGLLKIASTGKDFVYGLKYQFAKPILLWLAYIVILVVGLGFLFFGLYLHTKYNLKLKLSVLERESTLRKVNEAILEITNILLQKEPSENIYQILLQKAIEVIPNAQAGSVIVKKDDYYVYAAAIGYDLNELSKIKFSPEHIAKWIDQKYSIKKKSDMISYNKNDISEENFKILHKVGKFDEIVCSLNFAVELEGEIVLQFNLDNFEREDAFDEETAKLAQLFANHLGIVLSRKRFYERIVEQQRVMEYMSYHDYLTGLANRRAFTEFGEKLIALARREHREAALLFLDLSKFKDVNDKYGHIIGDELLRIIGERLRGAVRQDDLVARFGGDEFLILTYDVCPENMNPLLNRIVHTIEEPIKIDDKTLKLSVQMGVAIFPHDGESLDELIRVADFAMYRAKQRRVPIVFYKDEKD